MRGEGEEDGEEFFFQRLREGFQVRETNWGKEKIRREEEKKEKKKKRGGERGKQNERK